MRLRFRSSAALALVFLAASCGGGDSSTPPPTAGPSPSPSPTPSPTPSPSPTYTAFADLTGDRQFVTSCTAYRNRPPLGVPGLEGIQGHADDGLLAFTQATQSYQVFLPNNASATFGPGDLQAPPDANTILYRKPSPVAAGQNDTFAIVTPTYPTSNAIYMRRTFTNFIANSVAGFCITGVPTINTDLPTGPTVSYTEFQVRGAAFDARSGTLIGGAIEGTEASLVVNLQTGNLDFSFAVDANLQGTPTRIGTFSGQGGLILETSGLTGVIEANGTFGNIRGGFFGPQGREFGYVFTYGLDQNSDGVNELFVVGTVTGRR